MKTEPKSICLADFIEANFEPILKEWTEFAAISGPAGREMDYEGLRDHATGMLKAIVLDLRTPQTAAEQFEKSKGHAPSHPDAVATAAEIHGAGRAEDGFTVGEMASEYRALRASVLKLWTKANGSLSGENLEDMMRFNETIDQSLAESLDRYALDVKRSQEIYLGILGHDLQNPLGAVVMSSEFLLEAGELNDLGTVITGRILRASKRMSHMVKDLLDFTASRLSPTGVPINKKPMNLAITAEQAVEEIKALGTNPLINLKLTGDLKGSWDADRLCQVLSNLLGNAVTYSTPNSPIEVSLTGASKEIRIVISNHGPVISQNSLATIFSPFKRLADPVHLDANSAHSHLGLGLYIVEQIVTAHDGTITATSDLSATTFTIHLPR